MDRSASALEKGRAQWERVLAHVAHDFSESELAQLSWSTLKALAVHSGVTHALELAHLEIAWRERQPKPVAPAVTAEGGAQTDAPAPAPRKTVTGRALRPATAPIRASAKVPVVPVKPAAGKPAAKTAVTVKPAAKAAVSPRPVSAKPRAGSKTRTVPPRAAKVSSPAKAPVEPPSPASLPPPPPPPSSPIVPPPAPEPPIVAKATSEPRSLSPTRAVEDLQVPFTAFSNNGVMELNHFCGFVRWYTLLNKQFIPRHAEELFLQCKVNAGDKGVTYPQFRMRLVPELASKLRTTMIDIVKLCDHRGLPKSARRTPGRR